MWMRGGEGWHGDVGMEMWRGMDGDGVVVCGMGTGNVWGLGWGMGDGWGAVMGTGIRMVICGVWLRGKLGRGVSMRRAGEGWKGLVGAGGWGGGCTRLT